MKHQIIGKNIEVTDAIRDAVEKKLSRMDKYFIIDDSVLCRSIVQAYKVGAKVEITIFTPQMNLRTEVRDNDLYAAIDLAVDKLEDQMRRLKTRMDRKKERTSLGRSMILEDLQAEEEASEEDEIVRTKSIYLDPMNIDEAITRMEAIGHDFFLYLDSDEMRICVAYKRNDGGYGVIEAENEIR